MRKPNRKLTSDPGDTPSGDRLRGAFQRKQQDDDDREEAERQSRRKKMHARVSDLFNNVAALLPEEIEALTEKLDKGEHLSGLSLRYGDSAYHCELHGVEEIDFESLAGFQALDAACRKLNVDFSIEAGRRYNDPDDMAGYDVISVTVDAQEPYRSRSRVKTIQER